jgi:uncharacterized protein
MSEVTMTQVPGRVLEQKSEQRRDDPTTMAYFAAAREGRLLLQRCGTCGAHQFYPRPHCVRCGHRELSDVEASGKGVVYSLVRVHLHVVPGKQPPYFVGLVTLEEGPRIMANLDEGERRIGEPVRLGWQYPPNGLPVPVFSPDLDSPGHRDLPGPGAGWDDGPGHDKEMT